MTMQISATSAGTPQGAPRAGNAAGGDTSFATLLSNRQEASATPEKPPSNDSHDARRDAASGAERRAEDRRVERQAAQRAQATRGDDAARGDDLPDTEAAQPVTHPDADPATADTAPAKNVADEVTVTDPALLEWLAAMHRPEAQAAAGGADGSAPTGDAAVPADDAALAVDVPRKGAGTASARVLWRDAPGLGAATRAAAAETMDARAQAAAQAQSAGFTALMHDAAADAASAQAPMATLQTRLAEIRLPTDTSPTGDALAAVTPTTAAHASERAAAPLGVTLRTPATAPEFREALAAQVSVLARDGVQQARLHLNPADMGPISVHIAVHGTQAQVNFGADSAATRDLIQAGLPELAASLSEAGLTLTGGGVSQHARGEAGEGSGTNAGGRSMAGGESAHEADPIVAAQQARSDLRAALGGVDLFA